VEEFVWRKPAIQLYLNITNIDIVIIIKQKHTLVLKEERNLKGYKSRRLKKIFLFPTMTIFIIFWSSTPHTSFIHYSKNPATSSTEQLEHNPSVS